MPLKPKSSRRTERSIPAKKAYFKLSPKLKSERDARRRAGDLDVVTNLRRAATQPAAI